MNIYGVCVCDLEFYQLYEGAPKPLQIELWYKRMIWYNSCLTILGSPRSACVHTWKHLPKTLEVTGRLVLIDARQYPVSEHPGHIGFRSEPYPERWGSILNPRRLRSMLHILGNEECSDLRYSA